MHIFKVPKSAGRTTEPPYRRLVEGAQSLGLALVVCIAYPEIIVRMSSAIVGFIGWGAGWWSYDAMETASTGPFGPTVETSLFFAANGMPPVLASATAFAALYLPGATLVAVVALVALRHIQERPW